MANRVSDLGGWFMGRCIVEEHLDPQTEERVAASLVIMEPANGEADCRSMELNGLEALLLLKDLIEETIAAYEVERTLSNNLVDGG